MTRFSTVVGGAVLAALLHSGFAPAQEEESESTATDTSLVPRAAVMAPRAHSALLLKHLRHFLTQGTRLQMISHADGLR